MAVSTSSATPPGEDAGHHVNGRNSHWWIDTDGSIHFEDDPADVPAGKEGWFDPATFSVVAGLPGTEFRVISFNGDTGTIVVPEDGAAGTPGLRSLGTGSGQAMPGNTPVEVVGSNAWLKSVVRTEDFGWSDMGYNSDKVLTSANVVWPDGSTGVYTVDTPSTSFPGCVDAYHVTYVPASGPTKTVTQPAITRNSTTGMPTTIPAMTVT